MPAAYRKGSVVRSVALYDVDVLVCRCLGLEVRRADIADDGKHDRVRLLRLNDACKFRSQSIEIVVESMEETTHELVNELQADTSGGADDRVGRHDTMNVLPLKNALDRL